MSEQLLNLSDKQLKDWVLARVHETSDDARMVGPADYIRSLYVESSAAFRERLDVAVAGALDHTVTARKTLSTQALTKSTKALTNLVELADALEFHGVEPTIRRVALRGALGGHPGALDPQLEEQVLFALAGLQGVEVLFEEWSRLWRLDLPRLWPVATAGLRMSHYGRALDVVFPLAVKRAVQHPDFPLGEVLWAFTMDDAYCLRDLTKILDGLSADEVRLCRQSLAELSA